jgi:hypothetical protein
MALGSRNAWQFTKPLSVKILSFDAATNQERQLKTRPDTPHQFRALPHPRPARPTENHPGPN